MNLLDLTFLGVHRIDGQELSELPGLLLKTPPKKLARGRDQDRLIVYLSLSGNVPYSHSQYDELVGQVSDTFYNTSGSLTFALKSAVMALNTWLVEENMKTTSKGLYAIGTLILCNLRGNSLYIVQSGPAHVFHFSGAPRHLFDEQLAGKGLGLSQNARMYFAQVTLSPTDRLLFCSHLPPNWEKSINDGHGSPSIEVMRRRLLAIADGNVNALLISIAEGSGAMNLVEFDKNPTNSGNKSPEATTVQPTPVLPPAPEVVAPEPRVPQVMQSAPPSVSDELQQNVSPVSPASEDASPVIPPVIADTQSPKSNSNSNGERQRNIPRRWSISLPGFSWLAGGLRFIALFIARSIQKSRAFLGRLVGWVDKAVPRLIPEHEDEQPFSLFTQSWGLFIVIAIPVLLFVVSWITYHESGYQTQFNQYYSQAQQSAEEAKQEQDASAKRVKLEEVLGLLDKAEAYQSGSSTEVEQLRQSVQSSMDEINYVVRADFAIAFNPPLKSTMQVAHIAATETDLYLLDAVNGNVIRGYLNNGTYKLDNEFICGPGSYNDGLQVDNLVDIVVLPRSTSSTVTLMGIDSAGTILYCTPGSTPYAKALPTPDIGWKKITAISYDSLNLYVLDAEGRAVWVYWGGEKIEFTEQPFFFFEEQVPVMLETAVDMAITHDDLYLLHSDGHMAVCIFSRISSSPTRCNDPALYADVRPGYVSGIVLGDGKFTQMTFTGPNDPSLALLQPESQSVFRFSPGALELQNQIRIAPGSVDKLPKDNPISAMTFSPNRVLFVYVNGEVYFSSNIQ